MSPDNLPLYWDSVFQMLGSYHPHSLWQKHSDRVNLMAFGDWLEGRHFAQILKTDLFDEALSGGLYPSLREHAASVQAIDISLQVAKSA